MDVAIHRPYRRALGTAVMLAPLLAVFAIGYVAPLGRLMANSLMDANGFTLASYAKELSSPAFIAILLRTIWLSIVVTGLCLLLGYPVAYTLARMRGHLAAALLLVVSIPYITSILIRTYAWIVVLNPSGLINQVLLGLGITSRPVPLVFNQFGVYVGMVQVQLPLMIFPLYATMRKIERSTVVAAMSLGSSPASAFWHVFAPLSVPGVIAGSTLVFLSCLGFYVTPALLGGAGEYMLSQGISLRVLRLADFASAATQSTILLLMVVVLFVIFRDRIAGELGVGVAASVRPSRGGTTTLRRGTGIRVAPVFQYLGELVSQVRRPVLWIVTATVLLYLIVPLLIVIPLAFSSADYLTFPPPGYSLRWFRSFFSNRQWIESTLFSLRIGGMAAVASVLVGLPAAFAIVRRRMPLKVPLYLLMISPLVVPQVVAAVALYFLIAPLRLVGTEVSFVLAYMLLGVPYVVVVSVAGLQRFDRDLEIAAASLGARAGVILRTITLPLLLPSIISALLFAFIVAFDDVVYGLFLSGRGATPLPMRMWDNLRLEISPQIAVVAVLLFAALLVFYLAQAAVFAFVQHKRRPIGVAADGRS